MKTIIRSFSWKPHSSSETHLPVVVGLADVVEVTMCKWAETIPDGNKIRLKVQGSLLFVTYTIIQGTISSEMQVELKKKYSITWGRWGEKNTKTPQQHKSTYTIDTWHCHRGSNPAPASSHPVLQPLFRRWSDPFDRLAGSKRRRRGIGGGEVSAYLCMCVCVVVCNQCL